MSDSEYFADNFSQSFDARDWARSFVASVREKPDLPTDEYTMVGWFANAIMRGWDERERRYERTGR